jgi:hypothetical protein
MTKYEKISQEIEKLALAAMRTQGYARQVWLNHLAHLERKRDAMDTETAGELV